jgi:hypothetical protein
MQSQIQLGACSLRHIRRALKRPPDYEPNQQNYRYAAEKYKPAKNKLHHFLVSSFAAVSTRLKHPFWTNRRSAFFAKECRHSSPNLAGIKGPLSACWTSQSHPASLVEVLALVFDYLDNPNISRA